MDRLSGQADHPNVVVSESQLERIRIGAGDSLRVVGQLRSFNNKSGQGSRLIITVLAQERPKWMAAGFGVCAAVGLLTINPVRMQKYVTRQDIDEYYNTPRFYSGIIDAMNELAAVNRHYGRADYLPCIAWGQVAAAVADMDVGERLAIEGRVQSRNYTKMLDSGPVERTAFEVSVMQLVDEDVCM